MVQIQNQGRGRDDGPSSTLVEGAVAIPSHAEVLDAEERKRRLERISADDVKAACRTLGIDPVYDVNIMYIVDEFLVCQLPKGWERFQDPSGKEYYYNTITKVTQWQNPLQDYYRSLVFMQKEGAKRLKEAAAKNPPSPLEVRDIATYLGIDLSKEAYLVDVAKAAVNAPLPPDWEEFEEDDGGVRFFNNVTRVECPTHPLDGYFLELSKKLRAKKGLEGRRGPSIAKWYRFKEYSSIPESGPAPYPWADFIDMGQDSIHGRSQGKLYYYNFQTNEVSWHHPGPAVKQQLRDAAASYIQAVFRGHYHRKMRRLAGQHWKIDPTQDAIRRAKEAKAKEARGKVKSAQDARTNQAVTEIQRRFRGYRARKQYAAKRRSRAAVKVQSWWRGVLARRRAAWLSTSDPHINLIPAPRYPLAPLPESRHPASASRVDALVRSLFRPVLAYVAARSAAQAAPVVASGVPLLERSPDPPNAVIRPAVLAGEGSGVRVAISPRGGPSGSLQVDIAARGPNSGAGGGRLAIAPARPPIPLHGMTEIAGISGGSTRKHQGSGSEAGKKHAGARESRRGMQGGASKQSMRSGGGSEKRAAGGSSQREMRRGESKQSMRSGGGSGRGKVGEEGEENRGESGAMKDVGGTPSEAMESGAARSGEEEEKKEMSGEEIKEGVEDGETIKEGEEDGVEQEGRSQEEKGEEGKEGEEGGEGGKEGEEGGAEGKEGEEKSGEEVQVEGGEEKGGNEAKSEGEVKGEEQTVEEEVKEDDDKVEEGRKDDEEKAGDLGQMDEGAKNDEKVSEKGEPKAAEEPKE